MEQIKVTYVLPLLNDCCCAITNSDLWMSKGTDNVFALVINFWGSDWEPKQIIISLFEVTETTVQVLVRNLIHLLDAYDLRHKIITYVKGEGSNSNTLANPLKSIVECEILGLVESFQGTCFGHAFSRACQYATTDDKICKNLKYVFIKST